MTWIIINLISNVFFDAEYSLKAEKYEEEQDEFLEEFGYDLDDDFDEYEFWLI